MTNATLLVALRELRAQLVELRAKAEEYHAKATELDRRMAALIGGVEADEEPAAAADRVRLETVLAAHRKLVFVHAERSAQDSEFGFIDQQFSPLGPRNHVKAVRRRVAARFARDPLGELKPGVDLDAVILGRRHLLSVAALTEEYFRDGPGRGPRPKGSRLLRTNSKGGEA